VVQLNQVLSDETRAYIQTTVLPFVHQRASLRFSPGLHPKAKLQNSKRTLDTHRNLSVRAVFYLAVSREFCWHWLFIVHLDWRCWVVSFPLARVVCNPVWKCCESRQKARADTTIKQTWVWGLDENEDFRETLKDVVAQARLVTS